MGHMRFVWLLLLAMAAGAATPKKIVIIAGRKSHPPGAHEYLRSAKLLKVMLERSTPGARVELHFNGWPENVATLDTADSIVTISDGQDGHLGSPVPFNDSGADGDHRTANETGLRVRTHSLFDV